MLAPFPGAARASQPDASAAVAADPSASAAAQTLIGQPPPPADPVDAAPPGPARPSPAAIAAVVPEAAAAAAPQLPVVDLIGLRFSLQHLRLVGYGLLAVWGSEVVNLLLSPRLTEIGTRLHYTSQFLDLTPILLVAIGLIAFQGGLRRRPLELALLPLLLALLPLLSAFHFFLAPVSVANVITLTQKQQQVGRDQIERIDQQIDRAATILRESDSIDALLEGLQRIPGLQVRVPAEASVRDARQEVRRSLERERDRLRERIEDNLVASREAFLRRAAANAALALLAGLVLWGLHHNAMREMEQAIPFLDWMLVQGDPLQQPEALQDLLRFQRACTAPGWFSLLERCLRLVGPVIRRPVAEQPAEPEPQGPPPNPFVASADAQRRGIQGAPQPLRWVLPWGGNRSLPDGDSSRIGSSGLWRHAAADPVIVDPAVWANLDDDGNSSGRPPAAEGGDLEPPHPISAAMARRRQAVQRREERRRQRDLERYRALRRRIEQEGRDPFARFAPSEAGPDAAGSAAAPLPAAGLSARELRRLERDRRRARAALLSMARSDELSGLLPLQDAALEQELAEELRQLQHAARQAPPPRRGLAGLRHWFLSHL